MREDTPRSRRRLLVSTAVGAGVLVAAACCAVGGDRPAGPVSRWEFGEGGGIVAKDACGGSAGKLRGEPPAFRLAGPFGRPLCFFAPGQQVTGSDRALPHGASPGTLSIWFCRPKGVTDKVLLCYGARQRGCARGLWLVADNRLCFYFWGDPQDLYVTVPGGVAPEKWHFVAGVYDGRGAKLYYDGKLLGQVTKKLHTRRGGSFHVGANLVEGDGRDYVGMLDNVAVWARPLSPDEIAAEYRKGAARYAGYAGRDVAAYGKESRRRLAEWEAHGRKRRYERARSLLLGAGVTRVVFAVRKIDGDGHWYANFGTNVIDPNRKYYYDGGRLGLLDVATGEVTNLIDDPAGGVRDPQVHYDGRRILLSYRKGGQPYYHLYELDVASRRLRPLTSGPFDDLEPTWLPDGGIAFVSSRCKQWVPCYFTQVAVLYRCDADGGNIRRLSANVEHENTPWVLPDGRILYQRWEYVDRSQVGYHHLWTMNPDGTGQMIYFGNQHANTVMIDAKPIPAGRSSAPTAAPKVVASFSPGHGRNEHSGVITVVDPAGGPDAKALARPIAKGHFRDPYPLSKELFLVVDGTDRGRAGGCEMSVMTGKGEVLPLYALPPPDAQAGLKIHEPRPLRPRRREAVIPSNLPAKQLTGTVLLEDVRAGRNMAGVRPGEIKELLVLETLPKPYNIFSGMEPLSYGGTFLLTRVLGTVPVEADGSAFLELPAMRAVSFVALDADALAVKRMQSFMTVQGGESVSCVGCHEHRCQAPSGGRNLMATRRPPSPVRPIRDTPDVLDFPRDVQPILDRHCVACHDYRRTPRGGPMSGGIILAGDRGPMFSHSYYMLTISGQFSAGRNLRKSNYPPRTFGSAASPLLAKIGLTGGGKGGTHQDVKLTDRDKRILRLWIDTGAAYPGTYAAMGTGSIGHYGTGRLDRGDLNWPAMQAARKTMGRRCGSCHSGDRRLPDSPSDNRGLVPWAEGRMNALATGKSQRTNPAFRFNRHIVYNLTRPEQSLLLLAPLARGAGGYGLCKRGWEADSPAAAPLKATGDPDYQRILAAIRVAGAHLDKIKRFDMAGFRPDAAYVREMKRYGILPATGGSGGPIDVYATDRAYWRSFHGSPAPGR